MTEWTNEIPVSAKRNFDIQRIFYVVRPCEIKDASVFLNIYVSEAVKAFVEND